MIFRVKNTPYSETPTESDTMNKNNVKTVTCLAVSAGAGMIVGSALRNNATPSNGLQASLMWCGSIAVAGVVGEHARRWTSDTWDMTEMLIDQYV